MILRGFCLVDEETHIHYFPQPSSKGSQLSHVLFKHNTCRMMEQVPPTPTHLEPRNNVVLLDVAYG